MKRTVMGFALGFAFIAGSQGCGKGRNDELQRRLQSKEQILKHFEAKAREKEKKLEDLKIELDGKRAELENLRQLMSH